MRELIAALNEIMFDIFSALKRNFADYCALDVPISSNIMMTKDGTLLTVLEIEGVQSLVPSDTFRYIVSSLTQNLSNAFSKKGLIIQSVFSSDPTETTIEAHLEKIFVGARATNKKFNYTKLADAWLDAQKEALKDIVAIEKNYLLIWTTSAILSGQENKEMVQMYKEKLKNAPNLGRGGNPFASSKIMYDYHINNCNAVINALSKCGIWCNVLSVTQAIHEMRLGLLVSPERDINVIGSTIPQNNNLYSESDLVQVNAVSMREQKISNSVSVYDSSYPKLNDFANIEVDGTEKSNQVKVDGIYFQPTIMDRFPINTQFFNTLFYDLSSAKSFGKRIPYRIVFNIASDGLEMLNFKYHIASLLRLTNLDTKAAAEGIEQLRGFSENHGQVVKSNCYILTWGKTSEEAEQRSAILNTRIEAWGNPKLSIRTGNPIAGFASASMGFSYTGIAQPSGAPLERALSLLPLARPASISKSSPIIFRSVDGKPSPYENMMSDMQYWVTFIAAEMGAGKSVLANTLNTAFFQANTESLSELPYVAILDFGISSRGFINVLERMLPPHQAHMAKYELIDNTEKYCINPHQLGLGLQFPRESELDYQVNVYSEAISDPSLPLDTTVRSFLRMAFTEAFNRFSNCYSSFPHATPKEYVKGMAGAELVDRVLEKYSDYFQIIDEKYIQKQQEKDMIRDGKPGVYHKTSWWDVVFFLCELKDEETGNDYLKEALIAQSFAAFNTADLLTVIKDSPSIQQRFGSIQRNSRPFLDVMNDELNDFIEKYKLFSGRTQFSIQDAHAVSLDLDRVIRKTAASRADLQFNTLLFMYAVKASMNKFFLTKEDLESNFPLPADVIPPKNMNVEWVKEYHTKEVSNLYYARKRIMIDEFHYVKHSYNMMLMMYQFMRVVRKRNMEILLISQRLSDFYLPALSDREAIDLLYFYSTCFILSTVIGEEAQFIKQRLDIKDEGTMLALAQEIKSAKENPEYGSTMFVCYKIGARLVYQLVNNKLSSLALWCFSTTTTELKLRDIMVEKCNGDFLEAVEILAKAFEPRKLKEYIHQIRNELDRTSRQNENEYEALANLLMQRYSGK